MKRIIIRISFLKRLRNAEHFDFYDNIVDYILARILKPAGLLPFWNLLLQLFRKEDEIYKRYLKQEDTILVREAHETRKSAYMWLKRSVEANTYNVNASVKAAAESLMRILDNYSEAYGAPMNEFSAQVVNMIQDFRLPKYAAAVALVGVGDAIEQLKTANDAFMSLYSGRAYSYEEQKDEGSLVEARTQLDHEFVNFAEAVNVFYRSNELQHSKDPEVSATLAELIRFINSYIRQHETIYARRIPKYRPGSNDDTPSAPDEDIPAGLPQIVIASQEILVGDVSLPTGLGTQMSLRASDPEAFAAALYPIARGGVARLWNPETEAYDDFPIADFLVDDSSTVPAGLIVDVPASNVFFEKPFIGIGDSPAEVFKDDDSLAALLGLQYPATTRVN